MEKNVFTRTFKIPKEHPALPGHFPGQAVVPGVVLLEQVEKQLLDAFQGYEIIKVTQAKFIHLVLPEQPVAMRIDIHPGTDTMAIKAKWRLTLEQDIVCATGQFILAPIIEEMNSNDFST